MARLYDDGHGKAFEQIMRHGLYGISMIEMEIAGIRSLDAGSLESIARELFITRHNRARSARTGKRHMECFQDMLHSPIASICSMQCIVNHIDMPQRLLSENGKAADMPDSLFINDDIDGLIFLAIRLLPEHIDDARAHIHRQIIAIRIAAAQYSYFDMRHVCDI